MKKPFQIATLKTLLFVGIVSLLMFGYQNCSEVGFQKADEGLVTKIGDDFDDPPLAGEIPQPPEGSEGSTPPGQVGDDDDDDDDGDDGDHSPGGRWLHANCRIFGAAQPDSWQVSPQAQDMEINGHLGRLRVNEVDHLDVDRLFGAMWVGAANQTQLKHIFGIVRLNSFTVTSAENMLTHMRVNAVNMGPFRDLFGALCLSSHTIDSISNALTAVKIRGWEVNGRRAQLNRLERVAGNIRIKDMDVGLIERVGGYISIRNGNVDEIKHVRGLIRIRGTVRRLEDVRGPIHIYGPTPPEEVVNSGLVFFHQR